MSSHTICLTIMIVLAGIAIISLLLWQSNVLRKFFGICFVVSFIAFLLMVIPTSYFEGKESPHCPTCEVRVDTNYCHTCGYNMKEVK